MDADTRKALLARYKLGYQEVAATVQGLSDAALDARPPAGDGWTPAGNGWTPRQIMHHLADSEMTSALRLRRLLAEEQPVLASYDEEAFARRLTRCVARRARDERRDFGALLGSGVGSRRDARRERTVHRRDVAGNLRGTRPRPCGADTRGTRRSGAGLSR
jgi:DinB superfamily